MSSVDVIIPIHRPDEKLGLLLGELMVQTLIPDKIIIVETKVDEFLLEEYLNKIQIKKENIEIISIDKSDFDHGETRNIGIRRSSAEFFICMTQDAIPADKKMIENLIENFERQEVASVYARQIPHEDCNILEKITRDFNYPNELRIQSKSTKDKYGIKTYFCSNVCAAYRRSIFDKLGGFKKNVILNEDMIYASEVVEMGNEIVYQPNAKVYHSHNYSCMQQYRRNFDIGVSQEIEKEIFSRFSSTNEGKKLVKKTSEKLIAKRSYLGVIRLYILSGYKYIGYKMGKNYKKLPKKFILWSTMNKNYWEE